MKSRFVMTAAFLVLGSASAMAWPRPGGPKNAVTMVDCSGHEGKTTVCFKNMSHSTITKARCGSYAVPILTRDHTIPAGGVAAVVDLGDSVRTCRKEGVTATTEDGVTLHGEINGASVDDSTEVVFNDK